MKKLMFLSAFVILALMSTFAQTQQVIPGNLDWRHGSSTKGDRSLPEIYLKGNFIELGIAAGGSCGTIGDLIPAGNHSWYTWGEGFVADYQMDGWTVGTPPYSGDYFLPGTPWEGWLCQFTFQGNKYEFTNSDAMAQSYSGFAGVPPTSLVNTSSGITHSALWTGTATAAGQSLKVEQNFHFTDTDAKFIIDVTLTNVGPDPLEDVEYARAVDPDQEEDWTGNYTTSNYVAHQPDGTDNSALVVANGLTYGIPMGLMLVHPNAKAHVVPDNLLISSPDEALDFTFAPTQGSPYVNDVGVAVATRIHLLNPGQSVSFPVAYLLNINEIINPPNLVPISNWAIALMIGLIVIFTIIRFRRLN